MFAATSMVLSTAAMLAASMPLNAPGPADDTSCHATPGATVEEVACSLDGRYIAEIRADPDREAATLYLVDRKEQTVTALFPHLQSDDLQRTFERPRHPVFSLDSTSLFVAVDAWATANAIHRIDLADRTDHFLIDGNSNEMIPGGRWRGHLMVWRHRYHHGRGYDVAQIIDTHGSVRAQVPGSAGHDGDALAERWLRRQIDTSPRQ